MKKADRQSIFDKTEGVCFYCGQCLPQRWHADHFHPVVRSPDGTMKYPERDNLTNMIPACPQCNKLKNSFSMECFRGIIQKFVSSLNLYTNQYKFAKKYGLVVETEKKVTFWFEDNNYDMSELNKFKEKA